MDRFSSFNLINLIIATFTLIVGISTMVIGWYTLKSQRKTQENTRLLVDSRDALWRFLIINTDTFIRIETFYNIIKRINTTKTCGVRFNSVLYAGLRIDVSDLNSNFLIDRDYAFLSYFRLNLNKINELINCFFTDNHNYVMTTTEIDDYLNEIADTMESVYALWHTLLFELTPIIKEKEIEEKFDGDIIKALESVIDPIVINAIERCNKGITEEMKEEAIKDSHEYKWDYIISRFMFDIFNEEIVEPLLSINYYNAFKKIENCYTVIE